jgi:hypothetical protein
VLGELGAKSNWFPANTWTQSDTSLSLSTHVTSQQCFCHDSLSVQYKHHKLNKKKATALFISTYFYFLVYGGASAKGTV